MSFLWEITNVSSLIFEAQMKTEVLCGRNTVQIRSGIKRNLNLTEIQKRLQKVYMSKNALLTIISS